MRRWLMPGLTLITAMMLMQANVWAEETGCHSFASWNESQKYFEAKGGSKVQNVDSLDSDQDGLACEELIGFKADHINPNNAKKSAPAEAKQPQEENFPEQIFSFLKALWLQLTGFWG